MSSFYVSLDGLEAVRAQINRMQVEDLDPGDSTAPLAAQQFHHRTASSPGQMEISNGGQRVPSAGGGAGGGINTGASTFGPSDGLPEVTATDHAHGLAQAAIWDLIQQCVTTNGDLGAGLDATHAAYAQAEDDLHVSISNTANDT